MGIYPMYERASESGMRKARLKQSNVRRCNGIPLYWALKTVGGSFGCTHVLREPVTSPLALAGG